MDITTIAFWGAYFVSLYLVIFWLLVYVENGATDKKKQLKNRPFVSIVIPAYNEADNIKSTIESVLKLNYDRSKYEVLVVNDGSKDNTVAETEKTIKENPNFNIKLINQKNAGKGAALNNGLKSAKGEIFICLDADSRVEEDALNKMLPYFEDDEVAAVLPTIKVEKPINFVQKVQWFEYTVTFFLKKMMGHLEAVYVCPGPFSAYRKKHIQELGGFDEHNLTEDMEMAFKIQKAHYKIVQLMETVVWTKTPRTINSLYRQRNRWYKGGLDNMWKYKGMLFKKEYGEFGLLQMPLMWTSVLLSTVVFVFIYYQNLIKPLSTKLYNMSFINFHINFSKFFSNLALSILGLDYKTLFFLYLAFILGLVYIYTAFKSNNEKIFKEKIATPVFYLLFYPMAVLLIWCGIIVDLVRGKRQKW